MSGGAAGVTMRPGVPTGVGRRPRPRAGRMAAQRWLKGNTHTHTTYSDGDSPPEVVVDWYAEHGYDFLFLTDHNALIPDDHLAQLQRRGLAVWQGEEITMAAVHVNGLGLERVVLPE